MRKKSFRVVILLALVAVAAGLALPGQDFPFQIKGDVPYVPTPQIVVDEMLSLADLKPDDILYDLGCGDGRIVITAADRYGVQGIGIDIDPDRIEDSRKNAAEAKVEKLVEFREADLYKTDFRRATVVTLYLLTKVNIDLRPKLLTQLMPGTRVVSHRFGMGEWLPDKSVEVTYEGEQHPVYYWVIPANATGSWKLTLGESAMGENAEIELEQMFQFIHGKIKIGGKEYPLWDASLQGDRIQFTIRWEKDEAVRIFDGQIRGHSMQGRMSRKGHYLGSEFQWNAVRNPATQKPIEEEKPFVEWR